MTLFPPGLIGPPEPPRPRICRACGGLGRRPSLWRWSKWRRVWVECRACGGTGGDVHDERAWWELGR